MMTRPQQKGGEDTMLSKTLFQRAIDAIDRKKAENGGTWDGSPLRLSPSARSWVSKNKDAFAKKDFLFVVGFEYDGETLILFHAARNKDFTP